ncbi:helix-turn-helix domain-containing protein [Lutispora sp.]|uniref:helix-turn-helix domain-containing protein n=1 Tax=Lutispora sp. TaxID=2828727 RepID=UPI002B20EF13|nr:AraC family transcriptional regulator [Lutispora sp.]MEA4960862.1 AraC family transcriptional regulator [Lutispora sp.]
MMTVDLEKDAKLAALIPINNIYNAHKSMESFYSEKITVCLTTKAANIIRGTHFHDGYEFVITYADMPSAIIDNRLWDRKKNRLFVINPMQEHGMAIDYKGFSLCGIHIENSLINEIARGLYNSSNITFSNESFVASHDMSMLTRLFLEELKYKQIGYEFIVENLSSLIAAYLIRQIKHNLPSKPHNVNFSLKENIKKVIDYMNENYTVGISNDELSGLINMDKYSFIRNFKAQTSKTPYEYLLDLKIEKAKKMLKSNKYTITEISMACGFSSHSHFTSTFKRKTGLSPTEYRLSL